MGAYQAYYGGKGHTMVGSGTGRLRNEVARVGGVQRTLNASPKTLNPDGSKTEWCGQACLAFGLVCKAYGYNIARAV